MSGSGLIAFGCKNSKCLDDCDAANSEYYKVKANGKVWQQFKTETKIICLEGLLFAYYIVLDDDIMILMAIKLKHVNI